MWDIAIELYSGLGLSLVDVLVIMTALGSLLLAVAELRVALMCAILLFLSEFIIFYEVGMADYYKPLMVMMLTMVILIISLMIGHSKTSRLVI